MDVMSAKMNETTKRFEQMFKNHSSSIHNLEIQVGQLANSLSIRNQGSLPSNTEKNPKELLKAITLRSIIEIPTPKATVEYEEKKKEEDKEQEDEWVEVKVEKGPEIQEGNKEKPKSSSPIQPYKSPAPYPERLKK